MTNKNLISVYDNGILKEYEVKVDQEKLEKVKQEIIYNCSIIEHCQCESSTGLFYDTQEYKILNKKCGRIAYTREGRDGPDVDYYTYTYDIYHFPKIVNIIDDILKGNIMCIKELFAETDKEYVIDNYRDIKALKKARKLIDEYIKNNNKDTFDKLQNLINNYEHPKIGAPKESIQTYFSKLKECFEFIEIKSYSNADIDKIKTMFGDNWQEKIEGILRIQKDTTNNVEANFVKTFKKREKN